MNDNTNLQVIDLLKSWPERKRKIAVLRFELEKFTGVRKDETLEAMALTHGDSMGRPSGYISDKTLYIALNYQGRTDKMNADTKEAIVADLVELEQEQERLEYYVSLLEKRQAEVLRYGYVERWPWEEIASKLGVAPRTVRKIRDHAVDELAKMYGLTNALHK